MFVCFSSSSSSSSCGEPMALCFFFFSLWCCCLVCGCVYTGVVNGYHHLGFYLAFHSRSVWPSSDRSDGRNPQHIVAQHMKRRSSSSNSSYICIYLYFKKRTQQHVINIALSQCHLPHIKKMLLFVFLLLLLAAVKSYESWAAGFEEDLKKKYITTNEWLTFDRGLSLGNPSTTKVVNLKEGIW